MRPSASSFGNRLYEAEKIWPTAHTDFFNRIGPSRHFAAPQQLGRFSRDCVAKLFFASEHARLIQDQGCMRNIDSRTRSLRFDCCVFLFHSFSAVTFATQSTAKQTLGHALSARIHEYMASLN